MTVLVKRPKKEAAAYLEGARNAYAAAAQLKGLPEHFKKQLEIFALATEANLHEVLSKEGE